MAVIVAVGTVATFGGERWLPRESMRAMGVAVEPGLKVRADLTLAAITVGAPLTYQSAFFNGRGVRSHRLLHRSVAALDQMNCADKCTRGAMHHAAIFFLQAQAAPFALDVNFAGRIFRRSADDLVTTLLGNA